MRLAASSTVAIDCALDSSTVIPKDSSRPITISTCKQIGRKLLASMRLNVELKRIQNEMANPV
jgi:hypothetical protein